MFSGCSGSRRWKYRYRAPRLRREGENQMARENFPDDHRQWNGPRTLRLPGLASGCRVGCRIDANRSNLGVCHDDAPAHWRGSGILGLGRPVARRAGGVFCCHIRWRPFRLVQRNRNGVLIGHDLFVRAKRAEWQRSHLIGRVVLTSRRPNPSTSPALEPGRRHWQMPGARQVRDVCRRRAVGAGSSRFPLVDDRSPL